MKWRIVLGVVLVVAACGSGNDRDVAIASLEEELGFTPSEALCAVNALEDEFGSLSFVNNPDDLDDADALEAGAILFECMDEPPTSNRSEPEAADNEPTAEGSETDGPTRSQAIDGDIADGDATESPVAEVADSMSGDWTADQICTLFTGDEVAAVFGSSGAAVVDPQYESEELSVCAWNDPDDPSLVPRGLIAARQEVGGLVQIDERVDIPGADNADYRPEFLEGRDFFVVEVDGQVLKFDYHSETPGGLELAIAGASRWAAYQNGQVPDLESVAAQPDEPEAEAEPEGAAPSDGTLTPDSPDPGTISALSIYWSSCGNGDPDACDYLYLNGEVGSVYEEFGASCGGRETTNCQELLGDERGSLTPESAPPGTRTALNEGWEACAGGSAAACDQLYQDAPARSEYEWFGFTCGGRGAFIDCDEAIKSYGR